MQTHAKACYSLDMHRNLNKKNTAVWKSELLKRAAKGKRANRSTEALSKTI